MKITKISVYALENPLITPYFLSGGRLRFDKLDCTFVRLDTDDGVYGWGEGTPWGTTYLPAFGRGVQAGLAELAPSILGLDPRQIDAVNRAMDVALPGHPYVKSAVDIACWDILGKVCGLPICELLGGREPGPVPCASNISAKSPDEMLKEVNSYRDLGYTVHSCKIGANVDLDIKRIHHLSANVREGETIIFDLNRSWLPREAITVMNSVNETRFWFEQPCNTYEENLHVRQNTRQAISLDEGIKEYMDLVRAHRDNTCELVNIKIGRVGGLTKAKKMRDFCIETGIAMLIMETGGTVLADTAAAHMAQATPKTTVLATADTQTMIEIDPAPNSGSHQVNGCLTAPDLPGLGVKPDIQILGEPSAVYGS